MTNCQQLKMEAADGKRYLTDVADPETGKSVITSENYLPPAKKQGQIKAGQSRGRGMIAASLGNTELLKLYKTAFLCSREIPARVVLECYDWAIEQREKGNCVIIGFHSKIEKDVFHCLLAGTQPVMMALAQRKSIRI